MSTRGLYSIVRYRRDPARDEPRNIAVVFVADDGVFAAMRSIGLATLAGSVDELGRLDDGRSALSEAIAGSRRFTLQDLHRLAGELTRSITLTSPRPAAGISGPKILGLLYRALVARNDKPATGYTKNHVLLNMAKGWRRQGDAYQIGSYLDDFLVDAVVRPKDVRPLAVHVTSFAATSANPTRIEQEVGHFLFASTKLDARCVGIIQPSNLDRLDLRRSQERIQRWYQDAGIPFGSPKSLPELTQASDHTQLLPIQ